MFSIDLKCINEHRFEGHFKDHSSFNEQLNKKIITCPICQTDNVKRIYTGCSIQAKSTLQSKIEKKYPTLFDTIRAFNTYVKENYENVGEKFPDVARAIHYGLEEEKNIYGESSPQDIKELLDEGISIMPLIDIEKIEN